MNGDGTRSTRPVDWVIAVLATTMCVACILWNIEAPTRLGVAILTQQYMAFQLGLALTIAYLRFNGKGEETSKVGWTDMAIAVTAFLVLMYAALDFSWLLKEQSYRPWQITVIGTVVTIAVMEGIRRRAGWMLFSIVAVFLVYALFADKVPGRLIGKELSPVRLVQYVGFDPSAVFSMPLAVGTIIVLLFVFFGRLLFAAGGGSFFSPILPWLRPETPVAAAQRYRLSVPLCSVRFRAVPCRTWSRRVWSPFRSWSAAVIPRRMRARLKPSPRQVVS
ncbi:hypothetical protein QW131_34340 [Roseibium salinum]|nr:hypothetical protein [Roseibium salinum]